jgi:hypothetical protein
MHRSHAGDGLQYRVHTGTGTGTTLRAPVLLEYYDPIAPAAALILVTTEDAEIERTLNKYYLVVIKVVF